MNTKISKTFFIIQVCTVNAGLGPDLAIGTDPVKKKGWIRISNTGFKQHLNQIYLIEFSLWFSFIIMLYGQGHLK